MERYRIENIEKITFNGRKLKLFNAYEYSEDHCAYILIGKFSAPVKTANKNLEKYIVQESETSWA